MNRNVILCYGLFAGVISIWGCGPKVSQLPGETADLVPTSGAVTMDSKPLAHASVQFFPQGATGEMAHFGLTNEQGEFSLQSPRGRSGAPVGKFKVVISKFANEDGSPFAKDADPAEVGAMGVEHVPPKYSDFTKTSLEADVPAGGKTDFKFELTTK